ncbi:MAG: glycosyltransferase [Eubacterium sp.]|nr:glycosyltransferase [Eubacterium sp.]
MKHNAFLLGRRREGRLWQGSGYANEDGHAKKKVLMLASVASMIDQFNMSNICILLEMGYEVHVACNFVEGNTCDKERVQKLMHRLKKMHVAYHQWDCPRNIYAVCRCVKAFVQLWRLTGRHSFLWMHCQSPIGGVLARLVAHHKRIRVIYTAHGFHFYMGAPLRNWLLYYPVEKKLSYWTDILVTVNREDYWFAKRHLKAGKICYIPGVGVDLARFSVCKVRSRQRFHKIFQIPEQAKVLLSVGELNKGKNHRLVLEALAHLDRQDVYYLICGQGRMRRKLQCYAKRLGVEKNIRMPGFQENMPWIYQNADIFVFPSVREGMPVALIEAMASGMPCVVSDVRGNRELVQQRFDPNHSRQLAELLSQMLSDRQMCQRCGMENHKNARRYAQEIVKKRMKEIYRCQEFLY